MFTEDEKAILRSLSENYKWIARNKNGSIYVYKDKPQREEDMFKCQDGYKLTLYWNIDIFKHIFKGVTWENSPICFRKPILDDIERSYLKTVFNPFKHKIMWVKKEPYLDNIEFISVLLKNSDSMTFPYFNKGTMYKGMETNRMYSLRELGID